jgi:hypothetical protein
LGRLAFSNGNKICIDAGFMWHILACPARGWPSPRKHGNLLLIKIPFMDLLSKAVQSKRSNNYPSIFKIFVVNI